LIAGVGCGVVVVVVVKMVDSELRLKQEVAD